MLKIRSLVVWVMVLAAVSVFANSVQADAPLNILFIGNSFTNGGPIPTLVRNLATSAGLPTPNCVNAAVNSMTLEWHRTNAATLAYIDQGGWDYVVLQEYSTRPTDSTTAVNANPARFEQDVTWFYDRVKQTSPNAVIVLYETWARHENNTIYPGTFADRDTMQNQLNYWYHDAVFNYIPANATYSVTTDVLLAPCGEVWHANYHGLNYNLHGGDLYHANNTGSHVNALTIFGMIYKRLVTDLPGGGDAMEDYLRGLVDQTNLIYLSGGGGAYNYRPGVFAGTDISIMLPSTQVYLHGSVSDDGLPDPPAAVTVVWSQQSGPGPVTFANATALDTTVTLPSIAGQYVLRLTADDSELTAFDEIAVTVNPAGMIPIANSSFENPVISIDGSFTNKEAAGWNVDSGGTNAWGVKNPAASEMTGTAGDNPLAYPGDAIQYLYMNSGQTSQTLTTTLQANTTYTLTVAVARRLETAREEANYYIRLYAGTNLLAETTGNTSTLASGILTDKSVVYHSTASSAGLGQQLKIVLGTPDPHASRRLGFDNVRMYATRLRGDYNDDGTVDLADYTVWADHYGQSGSNIPGDGNDDGVVDLADYTIWADHYGETVGG
jgi:hypothetical protein